MHLNSYIFFDKAGEKQKLKEIMNDLDTDKMEKVSCIQEEFKIDLTEAFKIHEVYLERFIK